METGCFVRRHELRWRPPRPDPRPGGRRRRSLRRGHSWLAVWVAVGLGLAAHAESSWIYVRGYTDWELFGPPRRNPPGERGEGIYSFRFNLESGNLGSPGLAARTDNPTYITFSPSGGVLYAVNEVYWFKGGDTGAVSAFAIHDATGRLTLINQLATRGTGPC